MYVSCMALLREFSVYSFWMQCGTVSDCWSSETSAVVLRHIEAQTSLGEQCADALRQNHNYKDFYLVNTCTFIHS